MKLSEAIRLGSMLGPQIFGKSGVIDMGKYGTCALGAAYLALGKSAVQYCKVIEWAGAGVGHLCPTCEYVGMGLADLIIHLNDHHKWSRERIADWVATVEPQEEAKTEEVEQQELVCV